MRDGKSLSGLQDLCDFVKNTKDLTMIEVGCYEGESTEFWAKSFKKVYAIDAWKPGYDDNDRASTNVGPRVENIFDNMSAGYSNITKIKDFSYNVYDQFEDASIDLLYIDGEHTYNGVQRDINLFLPKIKETGWIAGHDYKKKWQGVMRAVDEFCKQNNLKATGPDMTFCDGSWIKKL